MGALDLTRTDMNPAQYQILVWRSIGVKHSQIDWYEIRLIFDAAEVQTLAQFERQFFIRDKSMQGKVTFTGGRYRVH